MLHRPFSTKERQNEVHAELTGFQKKDRPLDDNEFSRASLVPGANFALATIFAWIVM